MPTDGAKEVKHAGAASTQKEAEDNNTKMIYGPRGDEGAEEAAKKEPKTAPQTPIKLSNTLVTREEATPKQTKAREEAAGRTVEQTTGGPGGGPRG